MHAGIRILNTKHAPAACPAAAAAISYLHAAVIAWPDSAEFRHYLSLLPYSPRPYHLPRHAAPRGRSPSCTPPPSAPPPHDRFPLPASPPRALGSARRNTAPTDRRVALNASLTSRTGDGTILATDYPSSPSLRNPAARSPSIRSTIASLSSSSPSMTATPPRMKSREELG
ncbi:hypothetical protein B0H13DRAFT_2677744, partial [Mycena leptocephala]